MENKRNSAASSILNFLLQLLGVALFYWLLLYTTTHYWLRGFVYKIAKVRYEAGPNFTKELYLLLLIFVIFCYLANRFLLDVYHRNKSKQLIFSTIADYFIWPLQVLIMLIWNNMHIVNVVDDVSTLYNVYIITALLIIKNLIAVKLIGNGNGANSKASSKAA
jgi:signal transduction histidine kinase